MFENVRLKEFSGLPSRFEAAFVFKTRDAAERYRSFNDQFGTQVLHQVELVMPNAPQHAGCVDFLKWPEPNEFLHPTRSLAQDYWIGRGEGDFETITASPLRVVTCLDA